MKLHLPFQFFGLSCFFCENGIGLSLIYYISLLEVLIKVKRREIPSQKNPILWVESHHW
jgi:hypothetical protein